MGFEIQAVPLCFSSRRRVRLVGDNGCLPYRGLGILMPSARSAPDITVERGLVAQ
jgi:hypothetical protein